MPLCRAYHDAHSPEAVYHNNSACPHGTRIRATERREGPGIGRALCGQCVRLDLVSWPSAPDPDEPLSLPLTEDTPRPKRFPCRQPAHHGSRTEARLARSEAPQGAGNDAREDSAPRSLTNVGRAPGRKQRDRESCAKLDGDPAQYTAAASRFRELEMPFWVAVTEIEHAEILGGGPEADQLLASARETFERLGAPPWLERPSTAALLEQRYG